MGRDKSTDVAPEPGNLFYDPRTKEGVSVLGHHENSLDALVQLAVHERELEFKLKIRHGPQAAHHGLGLATGDVFDEQAIEVVLREQRGSTSLLQRALGIGYGRASRLIDFMAEDGIVGGFNGSSARDVLITDEEWAMRKKGA